MDIQLFIFGELMFENIQHHIMLKQNDVGTITMHFKEKLKIFTGCFSLQDERKTPVVRRLYDFQDPAIQDLGKEVNTVFFAPVKFFGKMQAGKLTLQQSFDVKFLMRRSGISKAQNQLILMLAKAGDQHPGV